MPIGHPAASGYAAQEAARVITCGACGKENQGHYKFCLGCGAELPPPARNQVSTGRHVPPPTPARVLTPGVPARAPVAPPAPQHPHSTLATCPACGASNDAQHRFCSSCGTKIGEAPRAAAPRAHLTAINPDGSEGTVLALHEGSTAVGRATGALFAGDQYLSPKHATFAPTSEHVMVTDSDSLNGVFRKLIADQRYPLQPGTVFRMGQELIRFESLDPKGADAHGVEGMGAPIEGYVGRIAMVQGRNTTGTAFPVPETGLNLGRERGEVLFGDDGYVSGLHCRISFEEGNVYLTDLGSSNGTFVRLRAAEPFNNGEVLLMGQQLFRITI